MFSRSSSQDVKSRAKARAASVQSRAYQATTHVVPLAKSAQETIVPLAKSAQDSVAPLAKSAQESAGRGLLTARAWTAPRVEASGLAVQERIAPAVSAAMVSAARRIEPPKASRRRRWPFIVAGIVVLGAGCAAAAQVLRSRQNTAFSAVPDPAPAGMPPASPEMGDGAHVDANGQVRTP